jgi:cell division protein FtsW
VSAPSVRHPGEYRWETRLLAVVTLMLVVFGIANTYAAGAYRDDWYAEARQQFSGAVAGGLLFLIVAYLDYQLWRRFARPLFYATVAGLALIALVARIWPEPNAPAAVSAIFPYLNGARRWIRIGPLQVQVSEIARFTLPVFVAALAAGLGGRLRDFKSGFLPVLAPVGLVALLVAAQPNLSMAILLSVTGVAVAFVAGIRISHLFLVGLLGAGGVAAMLLMTDERSDRLAAFMTPSLQCVPQEQVCESMVGIGHGGIFGVGFGEGTQKLGHLAYGYSDFILSVIGEEWGFFGVTFTALCFILFCWMGFRIARTARDPFGAALAGGLTAMVAVASFLHAAVAMDMMPATGLTLPFISVGRVSLVIYLVAAGVIVSIGRRRGRPARER